MDEWLACGQLLAEVEGAVQWWIGDWWVFGAGRQWGEGAEVAKQIGVNPDTAMNYGSVARAFQFSSRDENLSFTHYRYAMAAPAGEVLAEMKANGGRHSGYGDQKSGSQAAIPILKNLGISKTQSSRWQQLAKMPPEVFEQHVAAAKKSAVASLDHSTTPPKSANERNDELAQCSPR